MVVMPIPTSMISSQKPKEKKHIETIGTKKTENFHLININATQQAAVANATIMKRTNIISFVMRFSAKF